MNRSDTAFFRYWNLRPVHVTLGTRNWTCRFHPMARGKSVRDRIGNKQEHTETTIIFSEHSQTKNPDNTMCQPYSSLLVVTYAYHTQLTRAPARAKFKLGRLMILAVRYNTAATNKLFRAKTSDPVLYSHARGLRQNNKAPAAAAPGL